VLFETALTAVGAPGTFAGVTELDAPLGPVPAALVATTLKVYPVPLVRPLTTQLVVAVVQVNDPGVEVTL
jgi:hypothetical protein